MLQRQCGRRSMNGDAPELARLAGFRSEAVPRELRRWRIAPGGGGGRLVPAAACAVALAAVLLLRQPDPVLAHHAPTAPALQIEQVEHALDDMDLLNQLGAAITP